MIVHVVSFSPADDNAAVGGFEWRYKAEDAVAFMRKCVDDYDGGHNLALVRLDLPDGLTRDEVTVWIEGRLELIEPQGNFGKAAAA